MADTPKYHPVDLASEQDVCLAKADHTRRHREELPELVDAIVTSCRTEEPISHVDSALIPSRD